MRGRRLLAGLAIVMASHCGFTRGAAQVPGYSVTMTPDDYQLLYSRDIFSDSLLPASFFSPDSAWPGIQLRFKGHSTRYYAKKSWRFRFNTSQLFYGVRQLNFNSMYTDKSFLREKLAWDLFGGIGTLAPTASHALLEANGTPKGLHLLIPKVDRYLLSLNGRIVAPMYEANDTWNTADLTKQPDSLLKTYYDKEIGDASDYSDLAALIDAVNDAPDGSFADTVRRWFDLPSVLRWFAVNTLVMMGDSYNKNYFLYRDTSVAVSQWHIIPWDYDLSWGRTGDLAVPYPASLLNDGFAYSFPPLSGPSNVLKDRFLADPGLMNEFRGYVDSLIGSVFSESLLHPHIDSLAAEIREDVASDPQKWGTSEDFEDHVDALKYYVTARRNYLLKTFVNPPSGLYDIATIVPTGTGSPHHAVGYDGRLIATLWFHDLTGLDSLVVRAWPDSTPPDIADPGVGRHVRRWVTLTSYPDPDTARFKATVRWAYQDVSSTDREVGHGVQDERLLRTKFYSPFEGMRTVAGSVNPFANTATVDTIDASHTLFGSYFALEMSESYSQAWYRRPEPLWEKITSGGFIDGSRGFMAGEHGTVLRTDDAGVSWIRDSAGTAMHLYDIDVFPDSGILLAAGESGLLFRSPAWGSEFTAVTPVTAHSLRAISASPHMMATAAGDSGTILISTDWGVTWSVTDVGIDDDIQDIEVWDYRIVCAGPAIRILLQGFSGAWLVSETFDIPQTARAVRISGNRIWAVGDSGMAGYAESGDSAWHERNVPEPVRLNDIHFIDSERMYAAGEGGAIYYTADGGLTWFRQHTADTHDLYYIAFTAPDTGFAAGSGGTILSTTSEGILTSAGDRPGEGVPPESFILHQNFPNPFNPTTRIRFDIPAGGGDISLVVYDLLGRLVEEIHAGLMPGGTHEIEWDASGLASGVFFYRLQYRDIRNNETRTLVNKLLLLR